MGDYLIYVIVIVLVVLKIIFWTFYFYARSQRIRTAARAQHRFLVVDTRHTIIPGRRRNTDQMIIIQNEHLPAHDRPTDPQANIVMPPAYDDVVRGVNQPIGQECKPPSYDQIVQDPTNYSIPPGAGQQAQSSSLNTPSEFGQNR